jgi:hypothetical protein
MAMDPMGFDIMSQWMVEIKLPENPDRDFYEMIPKQRRQIDKLFKKGVIQNYTLSYDRMRLWVVLYGQTREDITRVIDSFPMRHYMEPEIHEIMFHQQTPMGFSQFSLN